MPLLTLERHLTAADRARDLRRDARTGLTRTPKDLPPKWFYDARGSDLFEQITRLADYYPTRTERSILAERGAEIAAASGAQTLVELGSGSSDKTRLLLDALATAGTLRRYVPVDVSDDALVAAADAIATDYPDLAVHGVVADFEHHLDRLPRAGRRMVAFLGGTIGNLLPSARIAFLTTLREQLEPGDSVLLGTGLVTDRDRLIRAYDDSEGVTAKFNRNILYVLNHTLGADFAPESFDHKAVWDDANEWIEMRLCSTRDQVVRLPDLDLAVKFAAGEEMRTEVSAKFRRATVEDELAAAGLRLSRWWTDTNDDFALSLATFPG